MTHPLILPIPRLFALLSLLTALLVPAGAPHAGPGEMYESQRLAPPSVAYADHFGSTLAVSGSLMIVGVENHGDGGAAYIFERDGGGFWRETALLLPGDLVPDGQFGCSAAINGSMALVGAYNHPNGETGYAGEVYVFEQQVDGQWLEAGTILPSDPAEFDSFGSTLALAGNRLAVSSIHTTNYGETSAGAVYLFEHSGTGTWHEVAKLQSPDPDVDDHFGGGLAISGDTLLVADAWKDRASLVDAGVVDVFERDEYGQWRQTDRLLPDTSQAYAYFGTSLALQDGRAVISAAGESGAAGAAYVFERGADGYWRRVRRIQADSPQMRDRFGEGVALRGDQILVGAPGRTTVNGISVAGAAYLFHRGESGGWDETTRLLATDPQTSSYFARTVALDNGQAVAGQFPLTGGFGAVYVYNLTPLIQPFRHYLPLVWKVGP